MNFSGFDPSRIDPAKLQQQLGMMRGVMGALGIDWSTVEATAAAMFQRQQQQQQTSAPDFQSSIAFMQAQMKAEQASMERMLQLTAGQAVRECLAPATATWHTMARMFYGGGNAEVYARFLEDLRAAPEDTPVKDVWEASLRRATQEQGTSADAKEEEKAEEGMPLPPEPGSPGQEQSQEQEYTQEAGRDGSLPSPKSRPSTLPLPASRAPAALGGTSVDVKRLFSMIKVASVAHAASPESSPASGGNGAPVGATADGATQPASLEQKEDEGVDRPQEQLEPEKEEHREGQEKVEKKSEQLLDALLDKVMASDAPDMFFARGLASAINGGPPPLTEDALDLD